jgi:putative FmdB family regulatory protein
MPTYQYACTECGERLEVVQKFTDDALTVCPACQGRLRKLFSPVGVVFKGSGFYKTDSRAGSKAAGGGDGKTAAASGGSGDGGSKDGGSKDAAAKDGASKESGSSSAGKDSGSSSTPSPSGGTSGGGTSGGGSKVA